MGQLSPPTVAIIGRTGVGKTTQSRRVARRLGTEVIGPCGFEPWVVRHPAWGEVWERGAVLDGVPLCPVQALAIADAGIRLDAVILLVVPAGVVSRRADGGGVDAPRRVDDHATVRAVADWYCTRGKLVVVDGVGSPESVTERILRAMAWPDHEATVIDLRDRARPEVAGSLAEEPSGVTP